MSNRPMGNLERSLAALTIGIAQGQAKRAANLSDTATDEYQQQLQVPIAGNANSTWTFTDQAVQWELPFLYAPLQRRVPFKHPHFSYGIELNLPTTQIIVIQAQVVGWSVTEQNWIVGATVRFQSQAPNSTNAVSYSAVAHLTFEGYATLAEIGEFAQ